MVRKEEIVIGTKREIEEYYESMHLKSRDSMYPPGVSVDLEFKPLEDQLKGVTEKGFGLLYWFRVESKPLIKGDLSKFKISSPIGDVGVGPQVALILERKFIWIVPEEKK